MREGDDVFPVVERRAWSVDGSSLQAQESGQARSAGHEAGARHVDSWLPGPG